MASAFIIEVNSQLQPDPNEETAALLRVLIHKVDNTTFGDDIPSIPQWTGPPDMIVQVQAMLFASLATSLFSAFFAMLGKQWVNRYASVDMRGSAIERSQNRQRKQDGVVSWYFDHAMESLPLMLQAALLLLGFALSRYLWEINTAVAAVVLSFTSSGVLFFLFIVVAGASSVSCPYQTPGAQILRRFPGVIHQILDALRRIPDIIYEIGSGIVFGIPSTLRQFPQIPLILVILRHILRTIRHIPHTPGAFRLVISPLIQGSICCELLNTVWQVITEFPNALPETPIALLLIVLLPIWLVLDACKAIAWLWVMFFRRLERKSEQEVALLDLRCILWTLQTSLDGPVRLPTLNYLATTKLANFDPALVTSCFDILLGCVKVVGGNVVIAQDMGQLAAAASMCCLRTLSHLMTIEPTSRVIEDTRWQYVATIPMITISFDGLPISQILRIIHRTTHSEVYNHFDDTGPRVQWEDYKPSNNEHVAVARALVQIAWFKYEHDKYTFGKVPYWILRFALHSLSQSPLPPTSVVADSLSIVAIALDCGPSNTAASGERYAFI